MLMLVPAKHEGRVSPVDYQLPTSISVPKSWRPMNDSRSGDGLVSSAVLQIDSHNQVVSVWLAVSVTHTIGCSDVHQSALHLALGVEPQNWMQIRRTLVTGTHRKICPEFCNQP